ncbi:MAG TPA: hypothetical protein VJ689_00395 [Gaiellaceae bacterium]|nr:hypothetical protein [Gaiellaceae bacterium]
MQSTLGWWSRRRSWVVLGRALGGIGTFIAAIVAGLQFLGDDGKGGGGVTDGGNLPAYVYTRIADDAVRLSVEVPTAWTDVRRNGWHAHGLPPFAEEAPLGPGLNASPNVADWRREREHDTPGVFVGASRTVLPEYTAHDLASRISFSGCSKAEAAPTPWENLQLRGETVTWTCRGETRWVVLAATSRDAEDPYAVLLQAKLVAARDTEAYERIVSSLQVRFPAS